MIYEVEPGQEGTMQSSSSGPKIKGKANVSDMLYGRPINDDIISIHSINDNSGRVVFSGKVFFVDDRDIKSKKTGKEFHLITMDITDNEDSISAKMFVTKTEDDEPFNKLFSKLKKGVKGGGIYIVARGKAQFDQYAGETIVMINDIAEIEKPPVRMDEASEKRVELHLHTQMSAMDAVSSVNDLINRAIYWGHKAIAVTDHGVVQSFPDAMKASNFNEKIKILYGVEGYLIDDSKKIVYNAENQNIDSPFVVFDIETTGLHNDKNNITEIGAVKVVNGQIVDKWSTFVLSLIHILQGLASSDKVVYLSTFSRVLAPSIRIAYMVLPKKLLEKFDKHFGIYSSTVPRFEQHTLNKFISGGYYSRHLSRVKNIYKKRRDKIIQSLGNADISGERVGLHIVVKTDKAKEIIEYALKCDVKLYDMDDYYMTENKKSNSIIIGYAGAEDDDIELLKSIFDKFI